MALLESLDIPLQSPFIPFSLKDTKGALIEGNKLFGSHGLLVVFTCNHCPYAIAVWSRLIHLAQEIKTWGIETVAINPNIHPDYPEDNPSEMAKKINEWGIPFPYLIDDSQEIAKKYQAQCTPDLYLFDDHKTLFYHGRIDDNWKDETKVTKQELKAACAALRDAKPFGDKQMPSMGCSIKWK